MWHKEILGKGKYWDGMGDLPRHTLGAPLSKEVG